MLKLVEKINDSLEHEASLELPFEDRQRARLKTVLDDGREVGLFLPRGDILRGGDLLKSEDGIIVRIAAAAESVSTASCTDQHQLSRACYHLGNRHVALQIGHNWLRYLEDHVLDAMVKGLGLEVIHEQAPFEPESGAYSAHHHH